MAFRCTGEMCMVHIGEASIDMGNYYVNEETGEKVLITRRELAEKYCQLVPVRIYVRHPTPVAGDAAISERSDDDDDNRRAAQTNRWAALAQRESEVNK